MANYKVAYGHKENIDKAIERGIIPPGCIILTEDSNEIFFYDLETKLKTYEQRYKFESYEEAESWVNSYNCKGQILSIHEEDGCNLYIVEYDNQLRKISTEPKAVCYKHEQTNFSNKWEIVHNLDKYPSVTVSDNLGNTIVGDINYIDSNSLYLQFSIPVAGIAYLN